MFTSILSAKAKKNHIVSKQNLPEPVHFSPIYKNTLSPCLENVLSFGFFIKIDILLLCKQNMFCT